MPPTPLQRAENDLSISLQSLQSTLSKQTRNNITTAFIPFNTLSSSSDTQSPAETIDQNARELEDAVDKLIAAEEERTARATGGWNGERVKELVRKWYRGMYPFLDLVLKVSQGASQVTPISEEVEQVVWARGRCGGKEFGVDGRYRY